LKTLLNLANIFKTSLITSAMAIVIYACTSKSQIDPDPNIQLNAQKASFDLIQEQIIAPNCATIGCHLSTTDNSFKQHGLVLEKSVAFKNMLGIIPKNENAKADGFKLVTAFKAAESLFFHKLNWNSDHHNAKNYGNPMPLGGKALFVGQIEFIRRWIEAGAPEKGNVVDVKLLEDKTESLVDNTTFTSLPAPKIGEGYQLKVDKFLIQPNFEREVFVRKPIGNKEDIYVNRFIFKSRPNSHHMVVYDFRDKTLLPPLDDMRDLRNPDNTLNILTAFSASNHIFLGGGTDAQQEYTFPEGTALLLPANATVDLNPHYFNKTNDVKYGENYVNFFTTDKANVKNVVRMLDYANQSISIEPNTRKTFTKSWNFAAKSNVVMLTSHTHKLGEKFLIKIKGGPRDGTIVYENTDWEHPLILNFKTPLIIEKGEGLTSEVTYFNNTSKKVSFGLTSDDEMNIIFGYYYEIK
jgi:hypothetical protein